MTRRLRLQTMEPCGVSDAYVGWLNDPRVMRFLEARFGTHDAASTRAFVESVNASGNEVLYGIFNEQSGAHIGNIKLGPIYSQHRRADVGLLIGDPASWGQGFATEAIAVVTEFAHADLKLHKLTAGAYAGNIGSIKAFLKAGWVKEAELTRHWWIEDGWADGVLLGHIGGNDPGAGR